MLPSFFKVSWQRFLVLIAAYSLTRLLFLTWNWPLFAHESPLTVGHAFILGLAFDTSAILMTNALSLLLWMLPARLLAWRGIRVLDFAILYIVNFICLGLNFIDVEFVKFIGKRTSYDLLFIGEDIRHQALSILTTYWYLLLSLLIFVAVVVKLLKPLPKTKEDCGWVKPGLWRLAYIFLVVIGIRGGFGFKPISPMEAFFTTKHELGLLALNTPFNLIKSRPNGNIEHTRYFATDKEALERLKNMTEPTRPPLGIAKDFNVVVLIVESFATEFTGIANNYPGYTPFFDSLAKKGFYYNFDFANARRSIEGIPAVICGLPSMMDEPILTSDFSTDRLDCLPKILGQHGYSTYFLHGAHNGSMHFDSFSHLAGFDNFIGLNEYPKGHPEDLDEAWGVLDEPMLQYAADVIDRAAKPTMLALFTLSSHHPYYIPPRYRGKFPKGTLEIHESIGYADYALKRFFETAATKPWFNKTVFVITADHTQKTDHKEYSGIIGPHRVPLLVYAPGLERDKVPFDPERITQQIDIPSSVYDLLGIDVRDRLLLGQSVFDLKNPGRSYNYSFYGYWYLDPKVLIDYGKPPIATKFFTHDAHFQMTEASLTDPEFQEPMLNLKAVLHYLNEGLVHNNLYDWRKLLSPL